MSNVWVFPYRPGSNSARDLAAELGVRRISHTNSRFRGTQEKTIINWGSPRIPEEVAKCRILNPPERIRRASDKLQFFQNAECRKPDHTTSMGTAREWSEMGRTVVERHILNGHSGAGIRLVERPGDLTEAPLYTVYVPKRQEYRVHVGNSGVICVQRKARRTDVPDDQINWKIRNNDNGFVFARHGDALGDVPQDVLDQAILAVDSLGLDFGAADVVFNDRTRRAFVLEVNTAPGLAGTTVSDYGNFFRETLGLE